MRVQHFNPLSDPRWSAFVATHPQASIFHTREWLAALHATYGYEPVAFTTSGDEPLSNALVFCRVESWLTGKRLVSLPFSDHCQPLAEGSELRALLEHVQSYGSVQRLKYVELRPCTSCRLDLADEVFVESTSHSFQTIDLSPVLPVLYKGLHDSCIRRKIKRAEREELTYESGRSEDLLQCFRTLMLLTRRRHKLPPQPPSWFQNLTRHLGSNFTIHVASKAGVPVASIATLTHKKVMVYKYGCSDASASQMGGTPYLFWKVMQEAKAAGMVQFDLGRSDWNDTGLIKFKEHLGAVTSALPYYRTAVPREESTVRRSKVSSFAREALTRLPDPLFSGVGQMLYRHMG